MARVSAIVGGYEDGTAIGRKLVVNITDRPDEYLLRQELSRRPRRSTQSKPYRLQAGGQGLPPALMFSRSITLRAGR